MIMNKMNNEYDLILYLHQEVIEFMFDKIHCEKELRKKETEIENLKNIIDEQDDKIQKLLNESQEDDFNE